MTLDDADRLLAWMRENGVVSARVGDVALVLGDPPSRPIDPNGPQAMSRRERAAFKPVYATPEDDPDLYDSDGYVPGADQ